MKSHAQVTVAISDNCPGGLEGFSTFDTRFPLAVFEAATEDGPGWTDECDRLEDRLELVDQ